MPKKAVTKRLGRERGPNSPANRKENKRVRRSTPQPEDSGPTLTQYTLDADVTPTRLESDNLEPTLFSSPSTEGSATSSWFSPAGTSTSSTGSDVDATPSRHTRNFPSSDFASRFDPGSQPNILGADEKGYMSSSGYHVKTRSRPHRDSLTVPATTATTKALEFDETPVRRTRSLKSRSPNTPDVQTSAVRTRAATRARTADDTAPNIPIEPSPPATPEALSPSRRSPRNNKRKAEKSETTRASKRRTRNSAKSEQTVEKDTKTPSLMTLPELVRRQIFHHVMGTRSITSPSVEDAKEVVPIYLTNNTYEVPSRWDSGLNSQALRLNKTLHGEAKDALYQNNVFRFNIRAGSINTSPSTGNHSRPLKDHLHKLREVEIVVEKGADQSAYRIMLVKTVNDLAAAGCKLKSLTIELNPARDISAEKRARRRLVHEAEANGTEHLLEWVEDPETENQIVKVPRMFDQVYLLRRYKRGGLHEVLAGLMCDEVRFVLNINPQDFPLPSEDASDSDDDSDDTSDSAGATSNQPKWDPTKPLRIVKSVNTKILARQAQTIIRRDYEDAKVAEVSATEGLDEALKKPAPTGRRTRGAVSRRSNEVLKAETDLEEAEQRTLDRRAQLEATQSTIWINDGYSEPLDDESTTGGSRKDSVARAMAELYAIQDDVVEVLQDPENHAALGWKSLGKRSRTILRQRRVDRSGIPMVRRWDEWHFLKGTWMLGSGVVKR